MSGFEIVIPKEYPYVILAAAILAVECFIVGMVAVAPNRFAIFTKEYMS